jgi:non-heme chloroperoxidase
MLRHMRKLVIWLVILLGLVAAAPAYYSFFGPTPPLPPGPGESVALADGTRLNVLQLGPGAHVVLVHGLPGSAYGWGALPELLVGAGRHVVVYDRKGYGFSDPRPEAEPATFESNAKDLVALLAALDLQDVTVVGWSYGGGTALRAAALEPQRIARLVLIGSAGPGMPSTAPTLPMRVFMSAPVREWISHVPPIYDRFLRGLADQFFSGEKPPAWWRDNVVSMMNLPGARHTQARESQEVDVAVLRPEDVRVPVLMIHGDDDRVIPLRVAEDLVARSDPKWQLVTVDDGSHMLPVTHAELLAKRIAAFSSGR